MPDSDGQTTRRETRPASGSIDRRTALRRVGGAAVALCGLAGVTGSVAAFEGDDGDITGADDYPRVTTRGHFDVHWWYGDQLTDGHTATDYDTVGAIPGWDGGPGAPSELVVAAHGWLTEQPAAPDHFATVAASLAENGYEAPVVGFSYDADTGVDDWWAATDIAERNGPKLAAFLAGYADRNPETAVRLTGHSLGARVVLSTIEALHEAGRTDVVASATLLGGAADDGAVSTGGRYGASIEAAAGRVDNFWKDDDGVLQWAYSTGEFDSAVGEEGCDGPQPGNYVDHNVDYVPDHFSYHEPGDGCMDEVVESF